MKISSLVIIGSAAIGAVVMASLLLSVQSPGAPANLTGMHSTETKAEFIPPLAGLVVLVAGVIFFLAKSKRVP